MTTVAHAEIYRGFEITFVRIFPSWQANIAPTTQHLMALVRAKVASLSITIDIRNRSDALQEVRNYIDRFLNEDPK